ncbi:MAG TPA: PqqD family peptide modification chaperone [Rhizomicrobium sp.]|nr:PqqD family peptide modification chaperone [Rhizomicrobium sp.]
MFPGARELDGDNTSSIAAAAMKLRSGLTLLPLDEDTVVFSEETRCLVSLNPTASLVFRELQRGTPVSQLPHILASQGHVGVQEAQKWVAAALEALSSHGLMLDDRAPTALACSVPGPDPRWAAYRIAFMPPFQRADGLIEKRYRLLNTRALIRFAHPAQVRLVDAVLGHLATDGDFDPTVVIEIHALERDEGRHLRSNIYRNGEPIGSAARLSGLAPKVKAALWQTAINDYDFRFYVHAGVVGTGESCILLPAAAGSGKSSLTTALAHSGYRYFSDEVALINRLNFQVAPMPLAICAKSTGWELMARYYPNILELPVHIREDDKLVRYIPPPAGVTQESPASVSHIIFPRYDGAAETELIPITRSEALGRLMAECLAAREPLDQKNACALVEWISKIDCYSLIFSSLSQAVGLIKKVASP